MTDGSSRAPVRVLVADDHPMYRSSLVTIVSSHPGLELAGEAGDGTEALARLRALRPDVAVIDLRMPGINGAELMDAVSTERLPTKVIVLSGFLEDEAIFRALERGAAGLLSKDADGATLVNAILAVAEGRTVIAPEAQQSVAAAIRRRSEPPLTPREQQVIALVAEGGSVPSIATSLQLSQSTVKTHLEHAYRKLGVSDRAAAVAEAMRRGLLV